jgi:uncharacterized protein
MAEQAADIRVQVCFAKPDMQILRDLVVPSGATVEHAIRRSGVLRDLPELDLANCRIGIYDRIEIYRPLIADPKESRRKRAEKRDDKKAR